MINGDASGHVTGIFIAGETRKLRHLQVNRTPSAAESYARQAFRWLPLAQRAGR